METHLERKAKSEESLLFVHDDPCRAKAHDDRHPPCSSLWSHGTGRLRRKVSVVCGNLKMGAEWGGKTRACAISTVAAFSGCHKWPPVLSKSASGSRCGAA